MLSMGRNMKFFVILGLVISAFANDKSKLKKPDHNNNDFNKKKSDDVNNDNSKSKSDSKGNKKSWKERFMECARNKLPEELKKEYDASMNSCKKKRKIDCVKKSVRQAVFENPKIGGPEAELTLDAIQSILGSEPIIATLIEKLKEYLSKSSNSGADAAANGLSGNKAGSSSGANENSSSGDQSRSSNGGATKSSSGNKSISSKKTVVTSTSNNSSSSANPPVEQTPPKGTQGKAGKRPKRSDAGGSSNNAVKCPVRYMATILLECVFSQCRRGSGNIPAGSASDASKQNDENTNKNIQAKSKKNDNDDNDKKHKNYKKNK